jgi:hypothetical protein
MVNLGTQQHGHFRHTTTWSFQAHNNMVILGTQQHGQFRHTTTWSFQAHNNMVILGTQQHGQHTTVTMVRTDIQLFLHKAET